MKCISRTEKQVGGKRTTAWIVKQDSENPFSINIPQYLPSDTTEPWISEVSKIINGLPGYVPFLDLHHALLLCIARPNLSISGLCLIEEQTQRGRERLGFSTPSCWHSATPAHTSETTQENASVKQLHHWSCQRAMKTSLVWL